MARIAKPWEELSETQKLNRLRNERAKRKRENESNLISVPMPKKIKKPTQSPNLQSWHRLILLFLSPLSVFYTLSILSFSSYLVYQFYLYDDLVTGLVIEFLAITFAILSLSDRKITSIFSMGALILVILYSSLVLHGGMTTISSRDDENINALRKHREIVIGQIGELEKSISALSSTYISKKNELRKNLTSHTSRLRDLDDQIKSSSVVLASNYSSLMIRVLCMIANMLLIHQLIHSIRKSK